MNLDNKLGTSKEKIQDLTEKLVKIKIDFLDETVLFHENSLNLSYLQKLHEFLFSDIYELQDLQLGKNYTKEQLEKIDNLLTMINKPEYALIQTPEELSKTFFGLYSYQLFNDGNRRTLTAYFKVYIMAFQLPIEICIDKENHFPIFTWKEKSKECKNAKRGN